MGGICRSPKIVPPRCYWQTEIKPGHSVLPPFIGIKELGKNIKLEFIIENIEQNHKYQILVKFSDKNATFDTEEVFSDKTKIIFNKCFIGRYEFEKQQILVASLIKDGMNCGSLKVAFGSIVGSYGSTFKGTINNNAIIHIMASGLSNNETYVIFNFEAKYSQPNSKFSDIADKFSYLITSGGKKIYSSESISDDGKFKTVNVPAMLIEKGFTVSFLDAYQDQIAYKDENIERICVPKNGVYLGTSVNKKNVSIFNKTKLYKDIDFIDYIKAGVKVKLSIGIDYTESNGLPNNPNSLHYLGPNLNDYEEAIKQCGMIVAYYDYNQQFPVYGYGALLDGDNRPEDVNMCFNVNFQQSPEIYTIDNVLAEYRKSFNRIRLAGPTNFYPLIRNVVNNIKNERNPIIYHILLILTDGVINDLRQTIDVLVEGSFLPLSVIIIGIGNDHFQEMDILDGDVNPLVDTKGVIRMRDLVQFVPYNKFRNNSTSLAEQVLEEVPRQIIEYYTMNKIYPNNLNNFIQNNQQFPDASNIRDNNGYINLNTHNNNGYL